MGKREVGVACLCMGRAAVRFGGAVGAAPPVKPVNARECL